VEANHFIRESAVDTDDASDTESIDGVSPEDHDEESASKTEWLRQKTIEFAENKYLDRLMSLPGLEETKAMFLNARAKVKAAIRRETSLKNDNFDVVFTGNEGTGKSTMAKLYAKFLIAEGLFKPNTGHNAISKPSSYYFSKTEVVEQARNNTSEGSGHVSQGYRHFNACSEIVS
jgi:DNA replication protein DnaC